MAWVKVSADRYEKEPFASLTAAAMALYNVSECKVAGSLTDGKLSASLARQVVAITDDGAGVATRELLGCGLWQALPEGGYYLPRYLEDNPTGEDYERFKASRQENGRKGGRPRKNLENLPNNLVGSGVGNNGASPNENLVGIHVGSENLVANLDETYGQTYIKPTPKAVPVSVSVLVPVTVPVPEGARENGARALAITGNGGSALVGIDEYWPGQRQAFATWQAGYPKEVADDLWPSFRDQVPAPEVWEEMQAGLAAWLSCDGWREEFPRFVTPAEKFLRTQAWTRAPGRVVPPAAAPAPRQFSDKGERALASLRDSKRRAT